jgi:hypothetical protein
MRLMGHKTHKTHFRIGAIRIEHRFQQYNITRHPRSASKSTVREHFESIFVAFTNDVHISTLGLKLILLYLQQLLNP